MMAVMACLSQTRQCDNRAKEHGREKFGTAHPNSPKPPLKR
jgi:hypothetical protein